MNKIDDLSNDCINEKISTFLSSDEKKDFCSDWSLTGPLIEKYKVELCFEPAFNKTWEAAICVQVGDHDFCFVGNNEHANPLRAALIAILKSRALL